MFYIYIQAWAFLKLGYCLRRVVFGGGHQCNPWTLLSPCDGLVRIILHIWLDQATRSQRWSSYSPLRSNQQFVALMSSLFVNLPLRGQCYEILRGVLWPVWTDLGLNKKLYLVFNFSMSPLILGAHFSFPVRKKENFQIHIHFLRIRIQPFVSLRIRIQPQRWFYQKNLI